MNNFIKNKFGLPALLWPIILFQAAQGSGHAQANEYVQCSFNRQIIPCSASFGANYTNPRIRWSDGKSQVYYGKAANNQILRDPLGGEWRYLDFSMGRSWSLTNMKNGNVIIWNGAYKDYGVYVGL